MPGKAYFSGHFALFWLTSNYNLLQINSHNTPGI